MRDALIKQYKQYSKVLSARCFVKEFDFSAIGMVSGIGDREEQLRKLEEEYGKRGQQELSSKAALMRCDAERCHKLMESLCVSSVANPIEGIRRHFERALVKEKYWPMMAGQRGWPTGARERAEHDAVPETERPNERLLTTSELMAQNGLQQHNTLRWRLEDLRVRIYDKETEQGGEKVHQYSQQTRQRLMQVYASLLQDTGIPEEHADIQEQLARPSEFAGAMVRAHLKQLKVLDRSKRELGETSAGLMELLIKGVQQQNLGLNGGDMYEALAEFLDLTLNPKHISEVVTSFMEVELPGELEKQTRLTLDAGNYGSASQFLFEQVRTFIQARHDEADAVNTNMPADGSSALELVEPFAHVKRGNGFSGGLMDMVTAIGLVESPSAGYSDSLAETLHDQVLEWNDLESETREALNPNEIVDFFTDFLRDHLWWGALREILLKIGFPLLCDVCADGGAMCNLHGLPQASNRGRASTGDSRPAGCLCGVPLTEARRTFEQMATRSQSRPGLLHRRYVPDFLNTITGAGTSERQSAHIWKAQMVAIMHKVKICGFVRREWKADGSSAAQLAKRRLTSAEEQDGIMGAHSRGRLNSDDEEESHAEAGEWLQDFAEHKWPAWLDQIWEDLAPSWRQGEETKPFLPKEQVHKFFKIVAFDDEWTTDERARKEDSYRQKAGLASPDAFKQISETYDNWLRLGNSDIFTRRGNKTLHLRGVWHECFSAVLHRIDNGIEDQYHSNEVFEKAIRRFESDEGEHGHQCLLCMEAYNDFMEYFTVANTEEVPLKIFQTVLHKGNISMHPSVSRLLWYHASKAEEASRRSVNDLADRVMLYLSRGLCFESIETLIEDELMVRSFSDFTKEDISASFRQVDEKTGFCGFLEPHEIYEMLYLLANRGLSLNVLTAAMKQLKVQLDDDELKEAFNLMDTNGDGTIDMTEFLGVIDYLAAEVIPRKIFASQNLLTEQVLFRVFFVFTVLAALGCFFAISLSAFQVAVPTGASGKVNQVMRVGLAIIAAVGLTKNDGEDEQDKSFDAARSQLYRMMGVTIVQLEAKRRTDAALAFGNKAKDAEDAEGTSRAG